MTAHVDDVVMVGPTILLDRLVGELEELVLVKTTGRLQPGMRSEWVLFLGKDRMRDKDKLYTKPKSKFVKKAAQLLSLETAKPVEAPTTTALYHQESDGLLDDEMKSLLRQVIGVLHYVQGDYKLVQFALRGVAVEADKATESTMAKLKHLVHYLLGCGGHVQVTKPDASKPLIQAWSDSDWAGDRATRKSVDCVVIKVYGAIVHVSSKGQMAIAQSSAEAERGGAHRAGLYATDIQNAWHEMYEDCLPIELLMDSSAGKIMAVRRGKGRVRHLEVRQLYLQRLTNIGRVKALKCRGDTNVADVGTKPIERKCIGQFMECLGVENSKDESVVNHLGLGLGIPVVLF
jgi:hypothetical protein